MNKLLTVILIIITTISMEAQNNIQSKILLAYEKDFIESKTKNLVQIKESKEITPYWGAFVNLHLSILENRYGNKDSAYSYLSASIKSLEEIDNKNSEDFALLSIIQGYIVQFESKFASISSVNKAKDYAQKSLKKDPNNLRALYSLAVLDFYTPSIFGGGKKVLGYLEDGLKSRSKTNDVSWGKNLCYSLLVNYYARNKDIEKATYYLEKGLQLYPNDPLLKIFKSTLNHDT